MSRSRLDRKYGRAGDHDGKRSSFISRLRRGYACIKERIYGAEVLFFDGTTFTDTEMVDSAFRETAGVWPCRDEREKVRSTRWRLQHQPENLRAYQYTNRF